MGARALQNQVIIIDLINQHPIGLNVAISVANPISG
jgi:hypothetical protein